MALKSEIAMWVEWTLQQDANGWQAIDWSPSKKHNMTAFTPIADALESNCHVLQEEIESWQQYNDSMYSRGAMLAVDSAKLVAWAKRNKALSAHELEAAKSAGFFLRNRLQCQSRQPSAAW